MKKISLLFILIFITLLPLWNLITPGTPDTHDGPDHVARIANFYQSLSEGNIVPRWAANLNWGYGHPILMFLYPLPSYVGSFFHATGFTFVDSTKLVFAISYVVSIIAFFLWARLQFGPVPAFAGSILYGFAPYRFVDLYVRGAIGEHMAFIFPPIIFWGLWKLGKTGEAKGGLVLALGTAGLLLSHNAVTLMILPLILLYGFYIYFFETEMRFKFAVISLWFVMLGFMTSAFFLVPAFFEGKYTLRDIVTKGDFFSRFVDPKAFITSKWTYGGSDELSKEIGFGNWIAIILSVILLAFSKGKMRIFFFGIVLAFFASLFIMTSWAKPLWDGVTILQKFQFPWRFLSVSVFLSAIAASAVVSRLSFRLNQIIIFLSIIFILPTAPMWRAKDYIIRPESYYTGIYNSTTDTGESSPIWSVRFMEHRPEAPAQIVEGRGTVDIVRRTTTSHSYNINIISEKARVLDNTLYFPNWTVVIDGHTLSLNDVWFQDPNYRGLINFYVPQGRYTIEVSFANTKLRNMSDALSLAGIAGLLLTVLLINKKFRYEK